MTTRFCSFERYQIFTSCCFERPFAVSIGNIYTDASSSVSCIVFVNRAMLELIILNTQVTSMKLTVKQLRTLIKEEKDVDESTEEQVQALVQQALASAQKAWDLLGYDNPLPQAVRFLKLAKEESEARQRAALRKKERLAAGELY